MISKLKTKTYKRLLSNFFSLSMMQMVSYILPLLTIPYLVRVLGVEKFGLVAFAQAMIQYFIIFSDYGFGLSATKQVAEFRDNKSKLNEIFSSVLFIKVLMVFISFIILTVIIFSINKFTQEWQLYYLTFGIVIGQALFPIWYFQGIEKMHITALINIVPKLVFTISIFIFIKEPEDYIYVPLINSLGFIFSGLVSLWLAFRIYRVSFFFPTVNNISYQIKEGWHIFLGIIGSNFALLNVVFILGLLTNSTVVGYYAAVEKIIRPLSSLVRPVINAIFPHLSNTARKNHFDSYNLSKKISFIVATIMFFVGVILFIFSDEIVLLVFGEQFLASSTVLKIMAFIPMINALLHIFIVPNMILFNLKRIYSKIILYSFFLSILFSILLIKVFSVNGAAITTLLIDLFISISMYLYLIKYISSKGRNVGKKV
jgi:PST family polysaccharide transporter